MRRIAIAGAALLVALGAGACGSTKAKALSPGPIEHAIAQAILTQDAVRTTVSCPRNAPVQAGYRFRCTAKLAVGTYAMFVVEQDGKGRVAYANHTPLRTLDSPSVARAIQKAIKKQRHLKSTVHCPAPVLQAKGLAFTCTAKLAHSSTPFSVTETDNHGHVKFIGRRPPRAATARRSAPKAPSTRRSRASKGSTGKG